MSEEEESEEIIQTGIVNDIGTSAQVRFHAQEAGMHKIHFLSGNPPLKLKLQKLDTVTFIDGKCIVTPSRFNRY